MAESNHDRWHNYLRWFDHRALRRGQLPPPCRGKKEQRDLRHGGLRLRHHPAPRDLHRQLRHRDLQRLRADRHRLHHQRRRGHRPGLRPDRQRQGFGIRPAARHIHRHHHRCQGRRDQVRRGRRHRQLQHHDQPRHPHHQGDRGHHHRDRGLRLQDLRRHRPHRRRLRLHRRRPGRRRRAHRRGRGLRHRRGRRGRERRRLLQGHARRDRRHQRLYLRQERRRQADHQPQGLHSGHRLCEQGLRRRGSHRRRQDRGHRCRRGRWLCGNRQPDRGRRVQKHLRDQVGRQRQEGQLQA